MENSVEAVRKLSPGDTIRLANAHLGVGYSEKEVSLSAVKRMLFSRVENPLVLQHLDQLLVKDPYLASLLTRPSTEEEMSAMVGIEGSGEKN